MKQYFKHTHNRWILSLFLIVGLAACDSSPANESFGDEELNQLSTSISEELSLTGDQQGEVENAFSQFGRREDREPGFMWELAAELQATLTDEQKADLFARTNEMERGLSFRGLLGFPGSGGFYGLGGFMGGRRGGISPADDVLNLTEEQEAALEEIHTRYREQFKTLGESFRNEEIAENEFISQMLALRDAKQAEVQEVLTAEQEAALEAYRAEREAEFAAFREQVNTVRNTVLGLTDDQAAAYDALYQEQLETRESLIEQVQAGTLSLADYELEIAALETNRQEVLATLLDELQYEIVQIHDALSVRSGKFGHKGKRRGFGGGRGQGHTFGS